MEKITTKLKLKDSIKDILAVEMLARDRYKEDLDIFQNPEILRIMSKIKMDEDRHIEMISQIIDFLRE